jgi:hypothetical protein
MERRDKEVGSVKATIAQELLMNVKEYGKLACLHTDSELGNTEYTVGDVTDVRYVGIMSTCVDIHFKDGSRIFISNKSDYCDGLKFEASAPGDYSE